MFGVAVACLYITWRTIEHSHWRSSYGETATVVSEAAGGPHHHLVPRTAGAPGQTRRRLCVGRRSRLAARDRLLGSGHVHRDSPHAPGEGCGRRQDGRDRPRGAPTPGRHEPRRGHDPESRDAERGHVCRQLRLCGVWHHGSPRAGGWSRAAIVNFWMRLLLKSPTNTFPLPSTARI